MKEMEVRFAGSIPAGYDRLLVPLLFRPYAEELARRARKLAPRRVLETAAGTGVVTQALHEALPDAELIATDLNQPMLDIAAHRIQNQNVRFESADAQDLPFDDGNFDTVVSQFGIMFFPDKARANAEARRVLRARGSYLIAIWDSIDRNPLSEIAQETLIDQFPDDPPLFLAQGPFGYHDRAQIERDLVAGGFSDFEIETVTLRSRSPSAHEAAVAMCYGSPMRIEVEEREPGALERTFEAVERAYSAFEGPDGLDAPMSAILVTATK